MKRLPICSQRARCVYSYLVAQAEALKAFLARTMLNHMISINVVDDTNFRIAEDGQTPATNQTIMNNLQGIIARSSDGIQCFRLHQPSICLPTAKGASLHKAFTSWLLTSSSGNSAVILVNRFSLHMHFAHLYLYLYSLRESVIKSNTIPFHTVLSTAKALVLAYGGWLSQQICQTHVAGHARSWLAIAWQQMMLFLQMKGRTYKDKQELQKERSAAKRILWHIK